LWPITEEEDRHRERENRYEIGRHRGDAGTDSAHDPVEEDEARDRACEREVHDVQPHSGGPAGDVGIALLKETERQEERGTDRCGDRHDGERRAGPQRDGAEYGIDRPACRAEKHEDVADEPAARDLITGLPREDDESGADRREGETDELRRGQAFADKRGGDGRQDRDDRRDDERAVRCGRHRQTDEHESVVREVAEDASEHDGPETPSAEIGSCRDRDRRENDRRDDEPHGRDLERRRARDSELAGDPGTAPSKRDAECDKRCEQRAGHRRTIRGTMPPCSESSSPASPDSQVVISPNTPCRAATGSTALLVLASRPDVYGAPDRVPVDEDAPVRPGNVYAATKVAAEALTRELAARHEAPIVILRPANQNGPRQHPGLAASAFAKQIAEAEAGIAGAVVRHGRLDAQRDFLDVRDMARAYAAALEIDESGTFNVGTGQAVAIAEI